MLIRLARLHRLEKDISGGDEPPPMFDGDDFSLPLIEHFGYFYASQKTCQFARVHLENVIK
jgi:hypothetical protein